METANYIAKIFIEVNQVKIDQVLQETAEKMEIQGEENRSLSCWKTPFYHEKNDKYIYEIFSQIYIAKYGMACIIE